MAATGKKKMKAHLKISPYAEMDKKLRIWIIGAVGKTLKDYEYSEDVELDPRKWDPGKLSKALEGLVRYELKLLATRSAEWMKDAKKDEEAARLVAYKEFPKSYAEIGKDIDDKCSIALDELVADKGDNKKALRDGKTALKKLDKVDLKTIFAGPRSTVVAGLKALASGLDKAGKDDKRIDAAFKAAIKEVDSARKEFDGDAKDCQSALDYLVQTGAKIAKNKDANPLLHKFADLVDSYNGDMGELYSAINDFEVDIDAVAAELKSGKMTEAEALTDAKKFEAHSRLDKLADKVIVAMKELLPAFANVEKELK